MLFFPVALASACNLPQMFGDPCLIFRSAAFLKQLGCCEFVCGAEGWVLVNHGVHYWVIGLCHFIEEPLDTFFFSFFELIRFIREVFFYSAAWRVKNLAASVLRSQ